MPNIQSKLPPIYHRFFPDFQSWKVPNEEIATCYDCTMCKKPKSAFLNTKCCTYFPHLPNYLVGGILQDNRPELQEGRERIIELIRNKKGIFPYGILPPVSYSLQSKKLRKKKEKNWTSAEAESLLCPYYDNGNCTIWDYRENCCSTHFCYSVGGDFGQKFWKTLNQYLTFTENELSKYALLKIGFSVEKINLVRKKTEDYGFEDENGKINLEMYNDFWGEWAGKEQDFYIKTFEIINQLKTDEFFKIGGINQEILLSKLRNDYAEFVSPSIPNSLIINPKAKIKTNKNNETEYQTNLGSVKVSAIINKFLSFFDGKKTTAEICLMIAPFRLNFEEEYLKKLYQLQILIPTN